MASDEDQLVRESPAHGIRASQAIDLVPGFPFVFGDGDSLMPSDVQASWMGRLRDERVKISSDEGGRLGSFQATAEQ